MPDDYSATGVRSGPYYEIGTGAEYYEDEFGNQYFTGRVDSSFVEGGGGDGNDGGQGSGEGSYLDADTGRSDTGGSTANSSGSTESAPSGEEGSWNTGSVEDAGNDEQNTDYAQLLEAVQAIETVSPDDLAAYQEVMTARMDAIFTCNVVIAIALFMSVGVAAVDTLIRSMERF